MEEHQKKAFDFSSDLTKQLITLSTGIIALTVTFSNDIIGNIAAHNRTILLWSWVTFGISILMGILTLQALTGNLDPIPGKVKSTDDGDKSVINKPKPILTTTSINVRSTQILQNLAFLVALGLTCWYGYRAINTPDPGKSINEVQVTIGTYIQSPNSKGLPDTIYLVKQ